MYECRAFCIISNAEKRTPQQSLTMIKKLEKDDIEKVKTSINKELALLKNQNLSAKQNLKSLNQIRPLTSTARPTLKIKSYINNQNNSHEILQNISYQVSQSGVKESCVLKILKNLLTR